MLRDLPQLGATDPRVGLTRRPAHDDVDVAVGTDQRIEAGARLQRGDVVRPGVAPLVGLAKMAVKIARVGLRTLWLDFEACEDLRARPLEAQRHASAARKEVEHTQRLPPEQSPILLPDRPVVTIVHRSSEGNASQGAASSRSVPPLPLGGVPPGVHDAL